jgi:hypothetical protein
MCCDAVCATSALSVSAGRPVEQAAVASRRRHGFTWPKTGHNITASPSVTINATDVRLHPVRGRSPSTLVAVGGGLGLIHVLTGPDHVSAIVTLSVGESYRAFWLGVRWGVGHSIGLLLMFAVFLEFGRRFISADSPVGFWADLIVGAFMIGLGASGCRSAWQLRREGSLIPASDFDVGDCEMDSDFLMPAPRDTWEKAATNGWGHGALRGGVNTEPTCSPKKPVGVAEEELDDDEVEILLQDIDPELPADAKVGGSRGEEGGGCIGEGRGVSTAKKAATHGAAVFNPVVLVAPAMPSGGFSCRRCCPCFCARRAEVHAGHGGGEGGVERVGFRKRRGWCASAVGQRIMALSVGIVHGVAGPGGVLGVLPAVSLHDSFKSVCYLGSFCLSSVLAMGVLAGDHFWFLFLFSSTILCLCRPSSAN